MEKCAGYGCSFLPLLSFIWLEEVEERKPLKTCWGRISRAFLVAMDGSPTHSSNCYSAAGLICCVNPRRCPRGSTGHQPVKYIHHSRNCSRLLMVHRRQNYPPLRDREF